MQRNAFPWIVAGLLLALVAGAAGAFVAWTARATPVPPAVELPSAAQASPVADPTLRAALEQLARELEALRTQLEQQSSERATQGAGPTSGSAALEALLLRVASALERSSGGGSTGIAAAQVFESELRMHPPGAEDPRTLASLQVASAVDYDRLLSEHKFESYQRLLQQFGTPDRITADGPTCTFVYDVEEGQQVGFKLYGGIVIDVWN